MVDETSSGREPITVVEIDIDFCTRTYGVAPCAAALGVTGDIKCFNTLASCQDTDNYDLGVDSPPDGPGFRTLRFVTPSDSLPRDVNWIPSLVSMTAVATELNVGGADQSMGPLGRRGSVNITLRDHPYHDRLVDPYWAERTYDAMELGTFWSKMMARSPYYQGRACRVKNGYIGQDFEDFRVRHFIIEKMSGPSGDRIEIIAKDPIKLLEVSRATAPRQNTAVLASTILPVAEGESTDNLTILPALSPAGAGAAFSEEGIVIIGGELFSFRNLGGDVLWLMSRALRQTSSSDHKVGDLVQEVYVVEGRVDEVLYELFVDYAGMDPAFIDAAAWAAECEPWASSLAVSAWITQPTGVEQLVGEILQQTLCYVWWDEVAKVVNLKALRPRIDGIDPVPTPVNDSANLIAGSVSITDRPEQRISQVWVYFDEINPTGGNSPTNFAQFKTSIDTAAESADQYGERRIHQIFARFLGTNASGGALALATRMVNRYRDTPKEIVFSVDAKDSAIKTGDIKGLTHHALVDFTGAARERIVQITSVEEVEAGHRLQMQAQISENDTSGYAIIVEDAAPDYGAATAEQKAFGFWIAPDSGIFSNGDPAYRII